MLKSTLKIEEKEDISRFSKLQAFLKRKSSNHRAKKANVLEITHIDKFLGEADSNEYLMMKIVLIMGIFGACRCDELVKMSVDDVTEVGTYLSIDIPMTKTDKPRRWIQSNFIGIPIGNESDDPDLSEDEDDELNRIIVPESDDDFESQDDDQDI
ncbi:hypothetical protein MTP99_007584 [Tenebrio molitor]|nr:hypothetical protein MTP99_007584 [Tenebrio molitor]